jgi:hypothetical protein
VRVHPDNGEEDQWMVKSSEGRRKRKERRREEGIFSAL